MVIEYGTTTLCAGGVQQPTGFNRSAERKVQIKAPIGAASVEPIGRACKTVVITFAIWQEHATPNACEVFALTHEDSLADNDDLTIEDDGSTSSITYTAAALVKCDVQYTGQSSRTTYTFICGPKT